MNPDRHATESRGAPAGKAPRRALPGLRSRLLLILLPVLVALFAFDSWSDTDTLGKELEKAYDQTLLEPAQALSDSLAWNHRGEVELTDTFHITSMFEAVSAQSKYLRVAVDPNDGSLMRILLGPTDFPDPPPLRAGVQFSDAGDGARTFYDTVFHGRPLRVAAVLRVIYDDEGKPWTALIQTARSTMAIDSAQRDLLVQTLLKDARTLLILVLIIWLGIGWGLRPLRLLRETIRERRAEDLSPLDTSSVPGEVRPLVNAMNLHLAQQREALDTQRQFLADASHQLRTPLAIMHTQTGYALRESDPQAIRNTLHGILQQLQRSRRVSEQLLSLAQAAQPALALPSTDQERCDANAVARDVVIEYLPQALDKDIDLGWLDARGDDADDDDESKGARPVAAVHASALGLHEVLANLLHNAIAYTPRGGKVNVSVRMDDAYVTVLIQDNGPGIAPQDRARAFERFQRLASSQPDGAPIIGSGLGLAIARTYLQGMRGTIELLDGENGIGLTVKVHLPLAL
ncbi:sensor histidine kinase [Diaphorobacter ruginosibacter]|uniref:sensor histidine kinase n=1 Tax=Diaphorobacter ruginosibacter TaxID=1715720 RepID=UPI00333F02ED